MDENTVGLIVMLVYVAVIAVVIVGMWKVFTKAGKPGWAAIIPIYNLVVWLQIVGRPIWWILLFLIPFVSLIVQIVICHDLARSFGKGALTTLGLVFIVGWPILGFSDAEYQGPAAG